MYNATAEKRPCAQGAVLRLTAPAGRKERPFALLSVAYKPGALHAEAATQRGTKPALKANKSEKKLKKPILTGQEPSKLPTPPPREATKTPTKPPTPSPLSYSKEATKPPTLYLYLRTLYPKTMQTTTSKK
jgi:hypothetical protein